MSQLNLIDREIALGATFSSCRNYRYSLWREWEPNKGTCVFIGLNPSTADEVVDDPTIRRCIRFTQDWGYGRLLMLNLFSIRATDPDVMKCHKKPTCSRNDQVLMEECEKADLVVAAWGNHGVHLGRSDAVRNMLSSTPMKCFKLTASGEPAHPLYQPANSVLVDL